MILSGVSKWLYTKCYSVWYGENSVVAIGFQCLFLSSLKLLTFYFIRNIDRVRSTEFEVKELQKYCLLYEETSSWASWNFSVHVFKAGTSHAASMMPAHLILTLLTCESTPPFYPQEFPVWPMTPFPRQCRDCIPWVYLLYPQSVTFTWLGHFSLCFISHQSLLDPG